MPPVVERGWNPSPKASKKSAKERAESLTYITQKKYANTKDNISAYFYQTYNHRRL
jgi:hypothetical protein